MDAVTFNPPVLSFGNIFDIGAARINGFIENHSILPQKFCFMSLTKEIEVETDKGCGIVFPGEKYPVSFAYKPSIENGFEEGHIDCKISTGKICARELKLKF